MRTFKTPLTALCALAILSTKIEANPNPAATEQNASNNLTYAVAWKQTAAEYRALYHQGFNIARLQVEKAIAHRQDFSKPLAIVTDVDDTLLLSNDYWGYLISQGNDFFDDAIWDDWIPTNRSTASPGSLDFVTFCRQNDVAVFYVTSRDQGPETFDLAKSNLQAGGFPDVTEERLTVLRDTSNKQTVQDQIRENYEVVVFLGDNLNDFRRKYYSKDIDQRIALMEEDHSEFGTNYILFPNPTDGHWIRAIYGDSEPPPTPDNRATLKTAATRASWPRD